MIDLTNLDTKTELDRVMADEPELSIFGLGVYDWKRLTLAERRFKLSKTREELRQTAADVDWAVRWLVANIRPTKSISRSSTSYGLKHLAEKYKRPIQYLTNGQFIAAALIAGYPYKRVHPASPNLFFGMKRTDIRRMFLLAPLRWKGDVVELMFPGCATKFKALG